MTDFSPPPRANHNDDFAVVHLDAKSDLYAKHLARITAHPLGRVFIVQDPIAVHWAGKSMVIAAKLMLKVALKQGFSIAHHISGSDWPVCTRAQMVAEIEADNTHSAYAKIYGNLQSERMHGFRPSSKAWRSLPDPPRVRLIREWVRANKKLVPLLAKLNIKRSHPIGDWQKGEGWWSLPQDIAADLYQSIDDFEQTGRLWGTACSDEHVVPTLIANHYPDRIKPFKRFIDWQEGYSHPQTIVRRHVPAIVESGAWFARKCDGDVDDFFLTAFPPFVEEIPNSPTNSSALASDSLAPRQYESA